MSVAKPKIAILEDHEDTREMLRISLESDFSVCDFDNTSELLSALEKEKFAAIIADIMLPGLDGFVLIKTVRSDPRFADLCVIAVTALAMAGDREKGLASGFTEYLVKPIIPQQIADVLFRCLKTPRLDSSRTG
jgi:CheY-like chemotaxis protein